MTAVMLLLLQSVTKINATDNPPQLKIKSYIKEISKSELRMNLNIEVTRTSTGIEALFTGAIGAEFNLKEFELRKDDIKLMNDGCCSSLHVLLIIQTPAAPN